MALNRYRLKTLISKNNTQAKRVEKLLDKIDYLIGGILLGNNFVNILAASIATLISIKLWGEGSIIIASILLTIVILIFAENTPKTFAAKNPEKVALPASWLLELIIKFFKPVIYLISLISKIVLGAPRKENDVKKGPYTQACSEKKKKLRSSFSILLGAIFGI